MSIFKKNKSKATISPDDIKQLGEDSKKVIKTALGVGVYNSEVDDEIGRSKEHARHMRKTRRRNFARKMGLIDPNYGKKAAGVLAVGAALGIAAATVPAVGPVLGPAVGGAVIGTGLAALETDAHLSVGDHAVLDSLMEDRDDNWRTNQLLHGYNFSNDFESTGGFNWEEDDEDDEFDDFVPEEWGGNQNLSKFDEMLTGNDSNKAPNNNNNANNKQQMSNLHSMLFGDNSEPLESKPKVEEKKTIDLLSLDMGTPSVPLSAPLQPSSNIDQLQTVPLNPSQSQLNPQLNSYQPQLNPSLQPQVNPNPQLQPQLNPQLQPQFSPQMNPSLQPSIQPQMNPQLQPQLNLQLNQQLNPQLQPQLNPQLQSQLSPQMNPSLQPQMNPQLQPQLNPSSPQVNPQSNPQFQTQLNPTIKSPTNQTIQFNSFPTPVQSPNSNINTHPANSNGYNFNQSNINNSPEIQFNLPMNKISGNPSAPNVQRFANPHSSPTVQMNTNINKPASNSNPNVNNNSNNLKNDDDDDDPFFELVSSTKSSKFSFSKYGSIATDDKSNKKSSNQIQSQSQPQNQTQIKSQNQVQNQNQNQNQFQNQNFNNQRVQQTPISNPNLNTVNNVNNNNNGRPNMQYSNISFNAFPTNNAAIPNNSAVNINQNTNFNPNPVTVNNSNNSNDFFAMFSSPAPVNNNNNMNSNNTNFFNAPLPTVTSSTAEEDPFAAIFNRKQ